MAVQYREDIAGTYEGYCHSGGAGEQIEGYCHSGSAISRGGCPNVWGSSSRRRLKNFVQAGPRAPAHEIGANIHILEILKILKIKIKKT